MSSKNILPNIYKLLDPTQYAPLLPDLKDKLNSLQPNYVSYQKEIHRDSKFAICHYTISFDGTEIILKYDPEKSKKTSKEKKTHTDPSLLDCPSIQAVLKQFLSDIGDTTLTRVEVKLIQTQTFPFIFNPHRDSQFWRLRHIQYLATVLISSGGIYGGNMQLFHSDNDQLGPFHVIETLPTEPGTGYIVHEPPHQIFHGMKSAFQDTEDAHRGALLLRFFNPQPFICYDRTPCRSSSKNDRLSQ